MIHAQGHSISRASKSVGIYYPTAKAINKVYIRENRIKKKTFRSTFQSSCQVDTPHLASLKACEPTIKATVVEDVDLLNREAEKRDSPNSCKNSSQSLTSLITSNQDYRCVTNTNLESQKILVKIKDPPLSQRNKDDVFSNHSEVEHVRSSTLCSHCQVNLKDTNNKLVH